jgi:hypothetical protein
MFLDLRTVGRVGWGFCPSNSFLMHQLWTGPASLAHRPVGHLSFLGRDFFEIGAKIAELVESDSSS